MLTELPPDLLGSVYDRLLIEDRLSLNRALPRACRVVRPIDRTLHVVRSVMKRRPGVKMSVREGTLRRFLDANKGDPTVELLLADAAATSASASHGSPAIAAEIAAVSEIVNELIELIHVGDVEKLDKFDRSNIFSAYASNFASSSIPDATQRLAGTCKYMRQLFVSFWDNQNVPIIRVLDAIEASPLLSVLFATSLSDESNGKDFLFNLLNYEKLDAVRHVISGGARRREQYGVTPNVIAYMVGKVVAKMCGTRSVDFVRFYMEAFEDSITETTMDFMLSSALVNVNIPVLTFLSER